MSSEPADPMPIGIEGVETLTLSAEHGRIELREASVLPRVGDRIEFVAGYSDTTVMVHDEIFGIRDGRIETVWPLWGRGRLQ